MPVSVLLIVCKKTSHSQSVIIVPIPFSLLTLSFMYTHSFFSSHNIFKELEISMNNWPHSSLVYFFIQHLLVSKAHVISVGHGSSFDHTILLYMILVSLFCSCLRFLHIAVYGECCSALCGSYLKVKRLTLFLE